MNNDNMKNLAVAILVVANLCVTQVGCRREDSGVHQQVLDRIAHAEEMLDKGMTVYEVMPNSVKGEYYAEYAAKYGAKGEMRKALSYIRQALPHNCRMTYEETRDFDLDGTLLNTIEDLGQAANYALERNGYATHSMASYPYFVGNGVRRLMNRVLPEDARDDETVDRVLGDFLDYYDVHCTDYTKPYNGMPELLQDLRDMGVNVSVAMAVASNKHQRAVDKIIPLFYPDINFVAIEGHREGVNVKPDTSVVFAILAKAQVAKADTLYVGDSGVDMEMARRACIDSVGVTWGFRNKKELVEYYADTIVNNPIDILNVVENGITIS